MELTPHLEHNQAVPIYIQLYKYIKNEIINNNLLVDDLLPSVRNLSKHLGISKTTVENTYQQLLAEGYIYSMPQKGYYVSDIQMFAKKPSKSDINKRTFLNKIDKKEFKYDFKSEYVEESNFNLYNWKKHLNYVINYNSKKLYSFGDFQGEEVLRKAIVKYIHRTRGVNADENNLVIGAGVQPLLQILSSILKKNDIKKIAVEDPGFNRAKNIFEHNEFELQPIEITEKGININQLERSDARLCYVSPSHQFPTGTVMLIDTRNRLINWANNNNAYIIEDDYNSELRYEGKPIPAMQGIDQNERVIYLGSFSTVLIPAIRISFMLLPRDLFRLYQKDKTKYAQTASKLEQLALANMMESGDFEKHIRKIRKNYAKKSEFTLKTVNKHLNDMVNVMDAGSGLNILLKLKYFFNEKKLLEILRTYSINISGISEFSLIEKKENPILILSFRGINIENIEKGILKLKDVLNEILN